MRRGNIFKPTEESLQELGKALDYMINGRTFVECPKPIGYLEHKPTKSMISVYTPISWFKKFMMRWCFGLTYHKR